MHNFANRSQNHLAQQLTAIVKYQQRLQEDANLHWWVIGGWSSDERCPFGNFSPAEAAVRAGKELADLTKLPAGPYSAPALLDLVLQKVPGGPQSMITLRQATMACAAPWRRSWCTDVEAASHGVLMPLSLAAAIAAESDDAPDWEPRFKRSALIPPDTQMSALDLALQMFRERLLHGLAS